MPQDAYTLKYLCKELNEKFKGGKINKIVQPDNDSIILTVYTKRATENLLISVNPSCPRISLWVEKVDVPLTAPNFCMLLRKHLLSSEIKDISLIGFDRIVRIEVEPSSEFFDEENKVLFIELMGRYSNIILTEKGKVLGGNRGVNFFDNGVRPLIIGRDYVYPPTNEKKVPSDKSLIEYFNSYNGDSLANYIASGVQGLATSTAIEIERKYFEKYSEVKGEKFFEVLNFFVDNSSVKPCVFIKDKMPIDACVYPYKIEYDEIKFFDTLLNAESFYFTEKIKVKEFTEKKKGLLNTVSSAIKKIKKKLSMLTSREKDALGLEQDRIKGELILSNIYKIKQGDKEIEVDNYYDNTKIKIELDTNLSPSLNAEKYYKKYNKEKRTLSAIEPQIISLNDELNYLNSLYDEISLSESNEDLSFIREEMETAGLIAIQNKKKKQAEKERYLIYDVFGFKVKVGRNNAENDKLTFSSKGEDMWLHAKDYHSAHLIIENGKSAPEKVIKTASEICAYYSKGREGGKTEVVYTLKKYVKKPPKSKLGFCTYTDFKSITVNPDKHIDILK